MPPTDNADTGAGSQINTGAPVYDGFLSYRSQSDYARARRIESFLEGLHRLQAKTGTPLRPLQICRDGSDFRLPTARDGSAAADRVWNIIRHELERSRFLLVLCSPGATQSPWMDREIEWFVEHQPQNILLLITDAADPIARPEDCFSQSVLRHGLHLSKIWYDLRGMERRGRRAGHRESQDELVRLAADLLGWNADAHGPLWSIYEREQLRVRRRQATWAASAAVVVLIAAALAGWYAVQATREASRARANAIVAAAQASADPLSAALMLMELDEAPAKGFDVARGIALQNLPIAELRGPQASIDFVQFVGAGQIAATSADGFIFLWNQNGEREPQRSNDGVGGRPVALAVSDDGGLIATATRERKVMVWSPSESRTWQYEVAGSVERLQVLSGGREFLAVTEDGTVFVLAPNTPARTLFPSGPQVAALHQAQSGDLLIAARNGDIYRRSVGSAVLQKQPSPPAEVLSEFGFRGPKYVRFSPDGEWYVVAYQNRLLLRSISRPRLFFQLDYGDLVNTMAFDSASRQLAVGGSRGVTLVWDVATGKLLRELDSRIRFWMLEAGVPTGAAAESFAIEHVAFSPTDPDLIAILTADSVVRVWSSRGGNPAEYRGHIGADSLTWSRDGRRADAQSGDARGVVQVREGRINRRSDVVAQ